MAIQHIPSGWLRALIFVRMCMWFSLCVSVHKREIGRVGASVGGIPSKVDNIVVDHKIQSDHKDNFVCSHFFSLFHTFFSLYRPSFG